MLLLGVPYLGPYNVNSIMNPLLVMNMLLGYLFNLYKGNRRAQGCAHRHPPHARGVPRDTPPIVHRPLERGVVGDDDLHEIASRYEEKYAYDPWYRTLYRNSYAYHGVHPFTVHWAAHATEHLGDVILVGGDPMTSKRLGFKRSDSVAEALEMAQDTVGPSPSAPTCTSRRSLSAR